MQPFHFTDDKEKQRENKEPWSEVLGARPLHAAPSEQVKLD